MTGEEFIYKVIFFIHLSRGQQYESSKKHVFEYMDRAPILLEGTGEKSSLSQNVFKRRRKSPTLGEGHGGSRTTG